MGSRVKFFDKSGTCIREKYFRHSCDRNLYIRRNCIELRENGSYYEIIPDDRMNLLKDIFYDLLLNDGPTHTEWFMDKYEVERASVFTMLSLIVPPKGYLIIRTPTAGGTYYNVICINKPLTIKQHLSYAV